jgi:hypothetical protein
VNYDFGREVNRGQKIFMHLDMLTNIYLSLYFIKHIEVYAWGFDKYPQQPRFY